MEKLAFLVSPATRGDPESNLLWTSKSLEKLSKELKEQGISVSLPTISNLLENLGFTKQANAKTKEGSSHEDRDEQFQFIEAESHRVQVDGNPLVRGVVQDVELPEPIEALTCHRLHPLIGLVPLVAGPVAVGVIDEHHVKAEGVKADISLDNDPRGRRLPDAGRVGQVVVHVQRRRPVGQPRDTKDMGFHHTLEQLPDDVDAHHIWRK